jgi:hypothetical protein
VSRQVYRGEIFGVFWIGWEGNQMARQRRKSKAETAQEWSDKQKLCWGAFQPKLAALKSWEDGLALVNQAPAPDTPCRQYYSNLGNFLHTFSAPAGSSYAEKELYLQLIQRIDASGRLKAGTREKIEADLRRAMEQQGPWHP